MPRRVRLQTTPWLPRVEDCLVAGFQVCRV